MNKCLYKIELYIINVIPVLLALISFINTTLFYFGIDLYILTYIGGVSFITLGFLYLKRCMNVLNLIYKIYNITFISQNIFDKQLNTFV